MIIRTRVWVGSLAALLLLAGCTSISPPSDSTVPVDWPTQQRQLESLTHWTAKGSLVIFQQKTEQASFRWDQQPGSYQLMLYGPLGIGRQVLVGNPQQVTLKSSNGKVFVADSAESLLEKQFGWHLPVKQLPDWIKGLPGSEATRVTLDENHRLNRLEEAGWTVFYEKYTSVKGISLPTKIQAQQGNVKILFSMRWELA